MTAAPREFKVGDKCRFGKMKGVLKLSTYSDDLVLVCDKLNIFFDPQTFEPNSDILRLIGLKLRHRKFKTSPVPKEIWLTMYRENNLTHDYTNVYKTKEIADNSWSHECGPRIGNKAFRYRLAKGQL